MDIWLTDIWKADIWNKDAWKVDIRKADVWNMATMFGLPSHGFFQVSLVSIKCLSAKWSPTKRRRTEAHRVRNLPTSFEKKVFPNEIFITGHHESDHFIILN